MCIVKLPYIMYQPPFENKMETEMDRLRKAEIELIKRAQNAENLNQN